MEKITGAKAREIIDAYIENHSILQTAKETGVSTVKVRKVLITEGLWESDTSRKIGELLGQGMKTEEIASALYMSVKNVQAYMPYERGVYGGEAVSPEAMRAEKYRSRMKHAASLQVVKNRGQAEAEGSTAEQTAERITEMNTKKTIECSDSKENRLGAFGLHLELDLKDIDDEDLQILKKYGSMQESISRDILVPSDITLHALNYAILRMFGWQNGHLHCFYLPEDVFEKLTGNRFRTWCDLSGVYFRFPSEDFEDIYWDDDYREGESIRSWMKKKYTGPYQYNGNHEHYLLSQMAVQNLFARWNEITVHEFDFRAVTQPEPYQVKLQDATIHQVTNAFADFMCGELIERLPLADVLLVENAGTVDFGKRKEELESKLAKMDTKRAIREYRRSRFTSWKREREFLESYNVSTFPVTEELIYRYDFGDGWEVRIRCEDVYLQDEAGVWKDGCGKIRDEYTDALDEVVSRHRPVCIGKDGIELVDDVGGIGGFCNMLRVIHEADMEDDMAWDERNQMLQWLDMMGWTGRRINTKRTL